MALLLFFAILLSATDKLWAHEVCCEGLGCYNDSRPFNHLPLPQCPEDMDIVMKVYTRQNPTIGETITRDTIPLCYIANAMTMFIVHGWLQSELYQWMHDMKDAVLARDDCNVIIVGWKGGSQKLWYPQSASNTRTVGGEIALVSNNIINNGNSSKDSMCCVGHSLGSHVCGHAGQQGQFGRITGLDPAGPEFEDHDWSVGLNPSCANQVDIIHTNGRTSTMFGLGTMKRLGHIDFYPNGGSSQPGCALDPFSGLSGLDDIVTLKNNTLTIYLELTLGCSHIRAYEFFIESLGTPLFLSRYECTYQHMLPVFCSFSSDAVQSMGFNAAEYTARGIFYLTTNSHAPFSQG